MSFFDGDLFGGDFWLGDHWNEAAAPAIPLTFTIDAEILEVGRVSVLEVGRVQIQEVAQ